MGKKDGELAQLTSALNELYRGSQESAATAAVMGQRRENPKLSRILFKLIFKFWGVKIMIMILLLMIAAAGSIWLFSGSTFKKESTNFVEQIQELATLATAEAHVKVVMEQEDNKLFGKDIKFDFPGTKREVLLVVPATVMAGVDLKEITSDHIKVNDEEKKLEITLPKATLIQDPAIQMDKVRTFSDEGLFRGEVKWDEGFDLAAEAQREIKEEAIEIGLLQTAERNAEKVLKEFFSQLGYSVTLTFK